MDKHITVFKALSDKTRLRIAYLLSSSKTELCVCEIVDSLEIPQYNVSRHLKIMKKAGLVSEVKAGKWVRYEINSDGTFRGALLTTLLTLPTAIFRKELMELKKRFSIRIKGKCLLGIQKKHLIGKKDERRK